MASIQEKCSICYEGPKDPNKSEESAIPKEPEEPKELEESAVPKELEEPKESEESEQSSKLQCGHVICLPCVKQLLKEECPLCRQVLRGDIITEDLLEDIRKRQYREYIMARINSKLIALFVETTARELSRLYGYDKVFLIEIGYSILYNQSPLDFARDPPLKEHLVIRMVDAITRKYPDNIHIIKKIVLISYLWTIDPSFVEKWWVDLTTIHER